MAHWGLLHHGKKKLLLVLEDGGNRLPRNDGNFINRDCVMEGFIIPEGLFDQCFSTFVRPRPGKFFFHKTRAHFQHFYPSVPFKLLFLSLYIKLTCYFIYFLWCCDPTRAMASSCLRFLDLTQRRITVGRTPLDE